MNQLKYYVNKIKYRDSVIQSDIIMTFSKLLLILLYTCSYMLYATLYILLPCQQFS